MVAFAAVLSTATVVLQAASASNQPSATGLIAGRVVESLSSRPVAGAIVSLFGAHLRPYGERGERRLRATAPL